MLSAILLIASISSLTLISLSFLNHKTNQNDVSQPIKIIKNDDKPRVSTVRFSAMGDMLAHDTVNQEAKTAAGYDYSKFFTQIKPIYEKSDVVFCNPETSSAGEKFGISGYPVFNAPIEFARDLSAAGCNLINLATNHIGDKGQEAINASLDEWEKYKPLAIAGANRSSEEQNQVRYFEKNNIKFSFLAFADFSNRPTTAYGLNLYRDETLVRKLVTEARANSDVVIVSMHWGVEDSTVVSGNQNALAQLLADLGTDIIIGTGPHVLQKVTATKRSDGKQMLTWYSIGNMLSSQLQTNELTGGVASWTIEKGADGIAFKDIRFTGTFMSYDWPNRNNLLSRTNLKLLPLSESEAEIAKFNTTLTERINFVRQTIGDGATLTIIP